MTQKWQVDLTYIDINREELIPEHYETSFIENYEVNNIKELKQLLIGAVEDNLYENKEWLEESIKPKVNKILDKIYVQYYDGRYIAEKYAEDKEGNTIAIVKADAFRITKKDSYVFVRTIKN